MPQLAVSRPANAVSIGGGLALLSPGTITEDNETLPYKVTLRYKVEHRRVFIYEMTATSRRGGDPINGVGLRKIAIQRIMQEAMSPIVVRFGMGKRDQLTAKPINYDNEAEGIAATYRLAQACGYPPINAVAERFGLSRSTARGRIQAARLKWITSTKPLRLDDGTLQPRWDD